MEGHPLTDIEVCEPRERDAGCWFIYIRTRTGFELRIATSSEQETHHDCAEILRWRDHPHTIPSPVIQSSSFPFMGLSWFIGFIALLWAVWRGCTQYSLVVGWTYTSHFMGGFCLAVIVFRLFWASISSAPFEWKFYAMGSPLIILLTAAITFAGKTVNAEFGSPTKIHIQGPIVEQSIDIQTLYFPKGAQTVDIPECVITVLDNASGKKYRIDMPGPIAERYHLAPGLIWEDEFYKGSLGWFYRKGTNWDSFEFIPKVENQRTSARPES